MSAVFRPPSGSPLERRLDQLTAEAARLAGPSHWQTGQAGSAHFTIRALEGYREQVATTDPAVRRYRAALDAAAARTGPARFEVTGLTLTPGTVMACARPLDDEPDRFLDLFANLLGDDGWLERERRDIWYLNLLHFTTTIERPANLVDWVTSHRSRTIGQVEIAAAELIRSRLRTGARPAMLPETLGTARLDARPATR